MKDLPIDIIPGTNPPKFKWKHTIHSPIGAKPVYNSGSLAPSVEGAVRDLIILVKEQDAEIASLKKIIQGLTDRVAAQSELLTKKAEKPVQPTPKKDK